MDTNAIKIVAAGPEYKKNKTYQRMWGRNWRAEWTTPVSVPILWLDAAGREMTVSPTTGGNETKGLKLKSANDKEYALRSINKRRDDVTPKEFKHTFIEDLIQDGVSMSHPYGAFALPIMEHHAGIYHTEPRLVYLPAQSTLDSLNEEFGNEVYLFEQRLSGDWSDANNLGNFEDFLNTDEVVKKILDDHDYKADQSAFVKARLFDMLIGDWDRHEDQWKWGKSGGTFIAVPRDRDQVFFSHNGFLIDRALVAIGNGFMQNFDYDEKNISTLNKEQQHIDRFFLNELSLTDWEKAAKDLQQSLTDKVIESSVQQLPPEIFAISGREIIEKLKWRRERLVTFATEYYLVLAKEVDVTGSKKRECFEIRTGNHGKTSVMIFHIDNRGKRSKVIFSRTFKPAETKVIRIYGIAGEDVYSIEGSGSSIRIKIIGGIDKDSISQQGRQRIDIYDDARNNFQTAHARLHVAADTSIHRYDYFDHQEDTRGFKPSFFYNDEDRFYVGLAYSVTKHKWRRHPYAAKQTIDLHYSLCQKAFSATYSALFPNLINRNTDAFLLASYDGVRWTNFFGLGNETAFTEYNKDFFRMQTIEWLMQGGVRRRSGRSTISGTAFLQMAKIIADTGRYIAKIFYPIENDAFENNTYVGVSLNYTFLRLNDSIVPTKGALFATNATYFTNTRQQEFFQKYSARVQLYVPLGKKVSLALKAGASTILCDPGILNSAEFYEHSVIGGPDMLRGFRRERFWGKSAFYNTNELRYITDLRSHLLNAKIGWLVFMDQGRVWMPGEVSNTLHRGYGTGFIFAPFTRIAATVTYGISNESRIFQVILNKHF